MNWDAEFTTSYRKARGGQVATEAPLTFDLLKSGPLWYSLRKLDMTIGHSQHIHGSWRIGFGMEQPIGWHDALHFWLRGNSTNDALSSFTTYTIEYSTISLTKTRKVSTMKVKVLLFLWNVLTQADTVSLRGGTQDLKKIAADDDLDAIIEGSLETKVPTIWTDEKHSQEEAEPGRNSDV